VLQDNGNVEVVMLGASAQGQNFEIEVADILRANGFRVTMDAKAARPRQTDLYARSGRLDLLIEAKSRKRKVDLSDIDALRSRLHRIASDIVGVIFTTSQLTLGAIQAIEMDRRREVLVFVGEEIKQLRSGRQNLMTLIERKREALRVDGKVWIGPAPISEFVGVNLPLGKVEFCLGNASGPYFASRTQSAHASYVLNIPDSGWGGLGREGMRLELQLTLNQTEDLRNILGYLHARFGLSNDGMFSIHQSDMCWHGVGAENFVRAAIQWRKRYRESGANVLHHSEELNYFDSLRGGWVLLSSQQRVQLGGKRATRDSFLHRSELAIQLPGVPLDTAPYLELSRYTGNNWAQFEYVPERLTHVRRLKSPIALEVGGSVVSTLTREKNEMEQERVVIGVIARNPFFGGQLLPNELQCDEMLPLQGLPAIELLLCDVRDWHDDGDVVDRYMLQGFEVTQAAGAQLIRPFGTWNKMVRRARRRQRSGDAPAARH
jgi:Holliday junction resolvase